MNSPPTVVLGAGVVGLMTAYHLEQLGHNVLVLERNDGPAQECSYGNAGIVALGHAEAWGSPAAPFDLIRALFGLHPAVIVSKFLDPAFWRWGISFLRQCSAKAYRANSERLLRTSIYSANLLCEIGEREKLQYHRSDLGALYLYKGPKEFAQRVASLSSSSQASSTLQDLTTEELVAMEPGLKKNQQRLAGGFLSPGDSSGDCRQFCVALAKKLQDSERVTFHYNCVVEGLKREGQRIFGVETATGYISCAALIVAAGSASKELLASQGCRVCIYPVKGYPATYPILDGDKVPRYAGIDETELVSYARYGDRLRMTSVAEFAGHNKALDPAQLRALDDYARRLCGDGVDVDAAEYWTGLRPSTPSSTPYLGRIRGSDNLYLNAGHGQLGWTMAAGCGRLVADIVSGNKPQLNSVSAQATWLESF